jgi:hypothetical protein
LAGLAASDEEPPLDFSAGFESLLLELESDVELDEEESEAAALFWSRSLFCSRWRFFVP